MARIKPAAGVSFDASCDVLVLGAGSAGLIAAMRASARDASVVVLERDPISRGSTALSAGLIPAAGTRIQRAAGISDSLDQFALDIVTKAEGAPERSAVAAVVGAVGPAIEWLADTYGLPFSVITNFIYPGHSAARMHGLPSRSGAELMDRLRAAAEVAGVEIINNALAVTLVVGPDGRIIGVEARRPDGAVDTIGCRALILATNGYGGNAALVSEAIPDMAGALYFGHPGNQGDAVLWGRELGAAVRDLPGYQGHGSVAHPHGILITWATIAEGGFQVNTTGERFFDESHGYSEAAAAVIAQPGRIAWTLFDERIARIARQFEDFRAAEAAGALLRGETISELAAKTMLPVDALATTWEFVAQLKASGGTDAFGRRWNGAPELRPPYYAVRVTGALFHTQGGLVVNHDARVMSDRGVPFPNLFAAGGAACGVSGSAPSGYLSGNGLLTAVAYGYLSGDAAARLCELQP